MRRRLNRFPLETPPEEAQQTYLSTLALEDLYHRPETLTPISSPGFFNNDRPLVLDIGCGRGEFIVREALRRPDQNYIGVDYHLKSLFDGVGQAQQAGVMNVRFIKTDVRWVFRAVPRGSVDEILLLFPPPVRRQKFLKKDLVTADLLKTYHDALREGGSLQFVTDVEWYFRSRVDVINASGLFRQTSLESSMEGGMTWYQRIWESHGLPSLRAEYVKADIARIFDDDRHSL